MKPDDFTAGSPVWQTIFISFAVVLILFEVVRGWRLGILRQLMRAGAFIAAYAAAFYGGGVVVPLVRPLLKIPDVAISALAGALLAFVVYAVIAGLGTILFKRTAQQNSGAVRLLYGLSGAFVGLFFGAFFIWLVLIGIRSIGSIANAQVQAQPTAELTRNPNRYPARSSFPKLSPEPQSESVTTLLARLKNSIELGGVGDFVKKNDVLPTGIYQTLNDVGTALAHPETAQRILDSPGAKEISEHPKIVALRNDREIQEMVAEGRLLDLLRDPRVVDAANDPTLLERIKKFDFQRALSYPKRDPNRP